MKNKRKILVIVGGGGFAWEGKLILDKLSEAGLLYSLICPSETHEYREFFISKDAQFYDSFTHRDGFKGKHIINFFTCLWGIKKLFDKEDFTSVVGIGTSLSIAGCIIGKFCNSEAIFVESIARTSSISFTGKFLLRFKLVNKILVQWPNMIHDSHKVSYRGNVL